VAAGCKLRAGLGEVSSRKLDDADAGRGGGGEGDGDVGGGMRREQGSPKPLLGPARIPYRAARSVSIPISRERRAACHGHGRLASGPVTPGHHGFIPLARAGPGPPRQPGGPRGSSRLRDDGSPSPTPGLTPAEPSRTGKGGTMEPTARSVKAVTFNKLSTFGLVEMVTFIITVLVAYSRSAPQPAIQLQLESAPS
jgi:hypothetical protein